MNVNQASTEANELQHAEWMGKVAIICAAIICAHTFRSVSFRSVREANHFYSSQFHIGQHLLIKSPFILALCSVSAEAKAYFGARGGERKEQCNEFSLRVCGS